MILTEFKEHNKKNFYTLILGGAKNKVIFSLLIIASGFYIFFRLITRSSNEYSSYDKFILTSIIVIILILILWKLNSKDFLPDEILQEFESDYKNDVLNLVQNTIPEIQQIHPFKTINPKEFYNSKLFDELFDGFDGDDMFIGNFQNLEFRICELNVLHFPKDIFNGLFLISQLKKKIATFQTKIDNSQSQSEINSFLSVQTKNLLSKYFESNKLQILISFEMGSLYIGFQTTKHFFETLRIDNITFIQKDLDAFTLCIDLYKSIVKDIDS